MKKVILVALAVCGIRQAFSTTIESCKDVPAYEIKKISTDTALSDSEAVVVFTCYEYTSSMTSRELVYACDHGPNRQIKTNTGATFRVTVKPGKHLLEIACYGLAEIRIPDLMMKSRTRTEITLYFKEDESMRPMKKPVIYLYPVSETQVHVKLDVKDGLGFTYPAYNNGWSFTASPDGDLHFGEKTYGYLFWEGNARMDAIDLNSKEGFVVSNDSLVDFLETKLTAMGLTSREKADFITYWCPLMKERKNCFIHFLFKEELEKYAPLSIKPIPDKLFRVFMLWKPVENEKEMAKITEQKLPFIERSGFTVIEWGGTEMIRVKP
jgi:hypothetical protein